MQLNVSACHAHHAAAACIQSVVPLGCWCLCMQGMGNLVNGCVILIVMAIYNMTGTQTQSFESFEPDACA
jgi:hypothetical protein